MNTTLRQAALSAAAQLRVSGVDDAHIADVIMSHFAPIEEDLKRLTIKAEVLADLRDEIFEDDPHSNELGDSAIRAVRTTKRDLTNALDQWNRLIGEHHKAGEALSEARAEVSRLNGVVSNMNCALISGALRLQASAIREQEPTTKRYFQEGAEILEAAIRGPSLP